MRCNPTYRSPQSEAARQNDADTIAPMRPPPPPPSQVNSRRGAGGQPFQQSHSIKMAPKTPPAFFWRYKYLVRALTRAPGRRDGPPRRARFARGLTSPGHGPKEPFSVRKNGLVCFALFPTKTKHAASSSPGARRRDDEGEVNRNPKPGGVAGCGRVRLGLAGFGWVCLGLPGFG